MTDYFAVLRRATPRTASEEARVVALFQTHDLFFHDFDVLGDLEKRLHDLALRRVVAERVEERMDFCHACGCGVGVFADLLAGGGSVHARIVRGKREAASLERASAAA